MGTENYNFTYIDPDSNIDIAGDTATFLNEIDAAIHAEHISRNDYNGAKTVCFGDSNAYGQGQGTPWYERVCEILGCEANNYSQQSASFQTISVGGVIRPISTQVNNAPADDATNPVKLVFVMGGINDYHYGAYDPLAFSNAITGTVALIHDKYPKATILVGMDSGSQLPNRTLIEYEAVIMRAGSSYNKSAVCLPVPLADLCLNEQLFTDQNHYSNAGAEVVKARYISTLFGNGIAYPITPLRRYKEYTQQSPNSHGIYGFIQATVTDINPFTCIRHDNNFLQLNTDFNRNDGSEYFGDSETLIELPGDMNTTPRVYPVRGIAGNNTSASTTFPNDKAFILQNNNGNWEVQASKEPTINVGLRYRTAADDFRNSRMYFEHDSWIFPTV